MISELPRLDMDVVTMQVVDWEGPIVEILFRRPLAGPQDVAALLRDTRSFMDRVVRGAGRDKAFFLTCYDGFSVGRDLAHQLQDAFLGFNQEYSKGDVRYGGTLLARTLVISTAIHSHSSSEHYATREEALASLRTRTRRI